MRYQLQIANREWKVPGERRVAKFIKRQNSERKQKKEKRSEGNGLFRLFKGERSKQNDNTPRPDDTPRETHPGKSDSSVASSTTSEKRKKVGFRQSVTKILSPPGRRSRKSRIQKHILSTEERPVIKAISEIEESTHYHCDPGDYETFVTPVESVRYTVKPLTPTKEEEEVVTTATKESEDEMFQVKLCDTPKSIVLDPYEDDNDGKTENCNCEGCIIL